MTYAGGTLDIEKINATLAERDALRAEVERLREALQEVANEHAAAKMEPVRRGALLYGYIERMSVIARAALGGSK